MMMLFLSNPMRGDIQALVFDLDDTLYPEIDFAFSGFNAVGEWIKNELKIDGFAKIAKQLFKNGTRGNIFNCVLKDLGVNSDQPLINTMVEVYREHYPTIQPFPIVQDIIRSNKGKRKLGIITDGYLSVQRNKVKALGLNNQFDCIVFTDLWGCDFWKPHPRSYEFIMDRFNLSGHECAYIADNPEKDFITAKKLEWMTIRIIQPGGEHSNKIANSEYEADTSVHSLEKLISIFDD